MKLGKFIETHAYLPLKIVVDALIQSFLLKNYDKAIQGELSFNEPLCCTCQNFLSVLKMKLLTTE